MDDEATGALMERFYVHLREGVGKAAALRQAQIEMREEYPNPYYWSAFVLSGDVGAPASGPVETPALAAASVPARRCRWSLSWVHWSLSKNLAVFFRFDIFVTLHYSL